MDSIRIKNIRSIVDSGEIQLSRINLLLGKNSSGKSSFLRLFPMLKESARHELRSPFLWFDENYDYGDFSNTLSRHAQGEEDAISMQFTWKVTKQSGGIFRYYASDHMIADNSPKVNDNYSVELVIGNSGEEVIFKRITIKSKLTDVVLESISKSDPIILKINGRKIGQGNFIWNYSSTGILPSIRPIQKFDLYDTIRIALKKIYGEDIIQEIGYYPVSRMTEFSDEAAWDFITSVFLKRKKRRLSQKIKAGDDYRAAIDAALWMNVGWLLSFLNDELSDYFTHSYYITPLRYNFVRYMRNRDLAVEYVESTGKNVMEYVESLKKTERDSYIDFLQKTLEIEIEVRGKINKSIFVKMKDGEEDNIVDVGYGYSQILPIATTLWDRAYKKGRIEEEDTIVIEQPEVHLHPAMQKKLARLFVAAIDLAKSRGKTLTLIIETHSQSLVNRLGKYVQNNNTQIMPELMEYYQDNEDSDVKISKDDVSVYLFNKKQGVTIITKTNYDNSGRIEQWPIGFLD